MRSVEVRTICGCAEDGCTRCTCDVPCTSGSGKDRKIVPCGRLWQEAIDARGDGLSGVRVCECGALYVREDCEPRCGGVPEKSGKLCQHRMVRHADGSQLCIRCGQERAAEEAHR